MNQPRKKIIQGRLHDAISALSEMTYWNIVVIYLGTILFFGTMYFLLSWYWEGNGPVQDVKTNPVYGFLNSLFFSTITATSVGYGEFDPHGFSKFVGSIQSFLSLLLAAIFVTKPISTKQEQALFTMHRLIFDSSFSSLREGLYIVRRDFETVHSEATITKELSAVAWHNLSTTYRYMQVLTEDISRVLTSEGGIYIIDRHREILLLEAVERTLERLSLLLQTLDSASIGWKQHTETVKRLQKMLHSIKKTLERWKKKSPNHEPEEFQDVLKVLAELEQLTRKDPT